MSKKHDPEPAASPRPEDELRGRTPPPDDDLIVVPKGRSPLVFYLTLAIMLFVLFIFTVGDQVFMACSGGQRTGGEVYMRWRHPAQGERTLSQADFLQEKRNQHALYGLLSSGRRVDLDDEDTASWIVLDALAIHAGIAVTDKELGQWILQRFGSGDTYKRVLQQWGDTPASFETALRRQLRIGRYQNLLVEAAAVPDPDEVLRRWRARHQEYSFDYVELGTADVRAAAEALAPDDEGLAAWYEALPGPQKQAYVRPARASAEVLWLSLAGEPDGSALLSAFPPEIEDAAAHANEYYQGFSYVRYRRETPDLSRGMGLDAIYLPYEEVEELALREAPLYDALTAWLAALRAREEAGETLDLAAEARAMGLEYERVEEKLDTLGWAERERDWAGSYIGRSVLEGSPGLLGKAPIVEVKAFVVVRPLEREEARTPELAEIRDEVLKAWVDQRAGDLAREKLEALRDELGERPTDGTPFRPEASAERFREVAEAAGYTVRSRPWAERSPPRQPDGPSPADEFFRATASLYALPEDTVAEAALTRDKQHAFLARVAGVRDPEQVAMDPNEIQKLRDEQAAAARSSFLSRTFDSADFLRERWGLWLQPPEPGS